MNLLLWSFLLLWSLLFWFLFHGNLHLFLLCLSDLFTLSFDWCNGLLIWISV
jgi:hypothetical protein